MINKIGTRYVDIITIFLDIVEIPTAFVAVVVVVNILVTTKPTTTTAAATPRQQKVFPRAVTPGPGGVSHQQVWDPDPDPSPAPVGGNTTL